MVAAAVPSAAAPVVMVVPGGMSRIPAILASGSPPIGPGTSGVVRGRRTVWSTTRASGVPSRGTAPASVTGRAKKCAASLSKGAPLGFHLPPARSPTHRRHRHGRRTHL